MGFSDALRGLNSQENRSKDNSQHTAQLMSAGFISDSLDIPTVLQSYSFSLQVAR
jgi:hypothetical protein